MEQSSKRPAVLYILVVLMLFQALSGLFGGIAFVFDPTGAILGMNPEQLSKTPFSSYLLPGLILLFLLGILPLFISLSLYLKPNWKWANISNIYRNRHWAWTYALYTGIMLIIWIDVQVYLIGYGDILQTIYALEGMLIVILTLLPANMRYFILNQGENTKPF